MSVARTATKGGSGSFTARPPASCSPRPGPAPETRSMPFEGLALPLQGMSMGMGTPISFFPSPTSTATLMTTSAGSSFFAAVRPGSAARPSCRRAVTKVTISGSLSQLAGDVNGDGYADLLVAAPWADFGGFMDSGEVRVYYGSASGLDYGSYTTLSQTVSYLRLGLQVSTAGDVNGDGYADAHHRFCRLGHGRRGRLSLPRGSRRGSTRITCGARKVLPVGRRSGWMSPPLATSTATATPT